MIAKTGEMCQEVGVSCTTYCKFCTQVIFESMLALPACGAATQCVAVVCVAGSYLTAGYKAVSCTALRSMQMPVKGSVVLRNLLLDI